MTLAACCLAPPAKAETPEPARRINIAADSLPLAIRALASAYGVAIGGEGALPDARPPALHGKMALAQALRRLLTGSGWQAREVGPQVWRIERAPTPLVAPPPPPPAPAPPPPIDITVTGTKRDLSLAAVPMTLHVLRPDTMSAFAPQCDTAAIAAALTGMTVTGTGPGQNRLFLQGIADSAFNGQSAATVAIMLDEARISYAGPEPDLRLVDVERVEVLEGPQGTLYGAGTLAGIYRISTAKPDPSAWAAHVAISGTAQTGAAGGTAGGAASAMVNAPLGAGAALRLVGYGDLQPGWIATAGTNTTNTTHTAGGRAALSLTPGAAWHIDLSAAHQTITTDDSAYTYATGQYQRPAQSAEPQASSINTIAARAKGQVGAAELTFATSRVWLANDQTLDASQGATGLGLAAPALYTESWRSRLWDNEARASGHFARLDWLAGLAWFRADLTDRQTLIGTNADRLTLANYTRTAEEGAVFGDLTWHFASQWQADIGARAFHATLADTVTLPNGTPTPLHQTHNGLSPSASLSWRPTARDTLYLRLASAFRQGDIHGDDGDNHTGNTTAPAILAGDTLDTVELGWRRRLGGTGDLALAVHGSRWRHLQSDSLTDHNLIVTRDAGNARIVGGEGHVAFSPWAGWHLRLAGEYESANLVKNALGITLDDTRLPVVPTYTAALTLARDVHLGKGRGTLSLSARQIGPGRLSFDPDLDRRIGPRLETGAGAQIHWRHIDLGLAVDNLLGASSDTLAYGNPFRLSQGAQYMPMRPRTIRLTLGFTP